MNTTKKQKKSNKKVIIIFSSIIVLAIVAVAIFAGRGKRDIEVTTEKVSRRTIVQKVSAIGKIKPETEVKISPETSGEIIEMNIKEGDNVKAGQLLARIKPDIINMQLEQSRFASEAVKSDIPSSKSNLAKAEADFKRASDLYAKKYISQQEYDIAKNALNMAKSALDAAELRYEQAKASYRQTQKTAAKTVIHSPISGVVSALNVLKGEKVVGTEMMQGTEIMVISDLSVMNAEVEVDENDIILVKIGDKAKVEVDALPGKVFDGEVIEIGHSAITSGLGSQSQVTNFKVKIRILNLDPKFRPGMSCDVEISTEKSENVVSVPLQSVTDSPSADRVEDKDKKNEKPEDEDKKKTDKSNPDVYVYLLNDNKVKLVKVVTGLSDSGYIEIKEGIKEGDEVISGSYLAIRKELYDGASVKVKK